MRTLESSVDIFLDIYKELIKMEILISIISGGSLAAVLLFVQFLINRHDQKDEKQDVITKKLDRLEATLEERDAITAKRAILRFGDEVCDGKTHSRDMYDQILEDADRYIRYCDAHPEFQDLKATITIQSIKDAYNNLFLSKRK